MLLSDFTNNEPVWVSGRTYKPGDVVRAPGDWYFKYVRTTNGAGTTDPINDTTNWRPDGGRAIKSVQRGFINISNSNATATATITAVNTAKTELRFHGGSGYNSSSTPAVPHIALTDSTTVTATMSVVSAGNTVVRWELTEYY